MYVEVTDDLTYLIGVIHRTLGKIRKRGDIDINISLLRSLNLVDCISCLKYIKGCIVFQTGPLSLTLVFIQKIFLDF